MKLASFHTGRKKILAFDRAFHGRTSGAVAATDNPKIQAPFNSTANVEFAPLNDINAAEKLLSTGDFAAVIIEGIQGVAGIRMINDDFIHELSELCKATGTLLILDEIQSGYGRTGRFFAHQYTGIYPDIITCAKGIANGFPMGAVLIAPHIKATKGMLGTTFGGNHLACAAAIAVLDVMESENMIANASTVGKYLMKQLQDIATSNPEITDIRGRGLMIGIEIKASVSELRKQLLFNHHIFTGGAGEHTVRLLPPLSLTLTHAQRFIEAFKTILSTKGT